MSEINISIQVKEEDAGSFIRCVRYLEQHTCLLEEKEHRLYAYAIRATNSQKLSEYFSGSGFSFLTDDQRKICWIEQDESCIDIPGLKRANVVPFSLDRYYVMLVLWSMYEEKCATDMQVYITMGEFYDKLQSFKYKTDRRKLRATLHEFKNYNLIDFNEPYTEDMKIRLYPTLEHIHAEKEFLDVLNELEEEDDTESEGEEEE